jgi:hypothetical protein
MAQQSKLHLYSLGIVATNKPLSTDEIEVTPIEMSMMLDGELSDTRTTMAASGKDSDGGAYSVEVDTSGTIKAKWLGSCRGNRLTSPDIRRGDPVVIWRFGDTDQYYWETRDDLNLRRLETVIWRFSGTKEEGVALTDKNCYMVELSTHKKLLHIHTSEANGEFCGYDIQLNADEGFLQVQDTKGNSILLNSPENQIELHNGDESFFNMIGRKLFIKTDDLIDIKTKTLNVTATDITTKSTTNKLTTSTNDIKADKQTTNATTNELTATTNNITATTKHTGMYTITGALTVTGKATLSGGLAGSGGFAMTGGGSMSFSGGTLQVDSITSAGNVTAPNIR